MKKSILFNAALYILFFLPLAWGDATVETVFSSGGFKGMGATETTTTQRYQGDKMYASTTAKFSGAFLSKIMGATENIVITRLDKGVYWHIDPKSKTYTEEPIAPLKLGPEEKAAQQKEGKPTTRVTKSEFAVRKTGAKETINGFRCEEYLVTWLVEVEELESKAKTRLMMENHLWNTPRTGQIAKLHSEEEKFHKALAKKIGIVSASDAKQMGMQALASMTSMSEDEMKKGMTRVKNEMAKMEGYPIRTVVNWNMEGDGKQTASAKEEASSEREERPTNLTGGLGGLISGLAGKVVQKKAAEKTAGGKDSSMFASTLEVKSIDTGSVASSAFDIPEGFTKKGEE